MSQLNHNFEYREQFKKSLRSYERSATGRPQRPIFSAIEGRRGMRVPSSNKEDLRIFGPDINASRKVMRNRQLRESYGGYGKDPIKNNYFSSPTV